MQELMQAKSAKAQQGGGSSLGGPLPAGRKLGSKYLETSIGKGGWMPFCLRKPNVFSLVLQTSYFTPGAKLRVTPSR